MAEQLEGDVPESMGDPLDGFQESAFEDDEGIENDFDYDVIEDPLEGAEEGAEAESAPEALGSGLILNQDNDSVKKATGHYEDLVARVRDAMVMQGTVAYRDFIAACCEKVEAAKTRLLAIDKPRDIIHAQEEVAVINWMFGIFKEPLDGLEKFNFSNPLFAPATPLRVQWDESSCKIIIRREEGDTACV